MQVELVRKQREVDLEKLEIERREKQYDAEVKKKADADRYAVEQAAEAEQAPADPPRRGHAVRDRGRGEGERRGEAPRGRGRRRRRRAPRDRRGRGHAAAKGFAEAEAKEKLAEAFEKFGEAAVLDLLVKMMPELARRDRRAARGHRQADRRRHRQRRRAPARLTNTVAQPHGDDARAGQGHHRRRPRRDGAAPHGGPPTPAGDGAPVIPPSLASPDGTDETA